MKAACHRSVQVCVLPAAAAAQPELQLIAPHDAQENPAQQQLRQGCMCRISWACCLHTQ